MLLWFDEVALQGTYFWSMVMFGNMLNVDQISVIKGEEQIIPLFTFLQHPSLLVFFLSESVAAV